MVTVNDKLQRMAENFKVLHEDAAREGRELDAQYYQGAMDALEVAIRWLTEGR